MSRKRRGNGQGSIYQRGDGRWCGSITVGRNGDGKLIRRTVYAKTQREVRDKLTRLQNQKLDGTLGEETKLTLAKFLTRWLEDVVRTCNRPATYDCYEPTVRLHISPIIGGCLLSKLTPAHVQGLYSELERTGRSAQMR